MGRCTRRTVLVRDWTIQASGQNAFLKTTGRAEYVAVTDAAALRGVSLLSRLEGIIPALETAHGVAWIVDNAGRWGSDDAVLLCVSGRGDKDVGTMMQHPIADVL
jgi:tryptophan synthase beta chain